MDNKKLIRLTESDLHNIVREAVYRILENQQLQNEESVNEGWKNKLMAGALGAASMFGNPATANAQTDDVYHFSQNKTTKANQNVNPDDLDDVYYFSRNKTPKAPKVKKDVDDLDDVYYFSRKKKPSVTNTIPKVNMPLDKGKTNQQYKFNSPFKNKKGSVEVGSPKIIGVDTGSGNFTDKNKWVKQ